MADNPLITANPKPRSRWQGKVDKAMLEDFVAESNRRNFVIASGKPYFVGRKLNADGEWVHYLDRTA